MTANTAIQGGLFRRCKVWTGSAVVIFAGSFTDVLFPALRLAYLVVPSDMVDIFAAAESVSTHHPPLIDQAILCDFIREGHFARHVRRMRELYAERLSVLVRVCPRAARRIAGDSSRRSWLANCGLVARRTFC